LNNHYIYFYLDPRKRGKFCYKNIDFCFLYEPFYVGQGIKKRLYSHLNHAKKPIKIKHPLYQKIRKILRNKFTPIIIRNIDNLSKQEANDFETLFIRSIGRIAKGGQLCNLTDGGEGSEGYKHTNKAKLKIKKNNSHYWLGKVKTAEVKLKISISRRLNPIAGFTGKHHTKKTKLQCGLARKGKRFTTEQKEKLKGRKPKNALWWKVISPEGEIFILHGLAKLCEQNNLRQGHLWSVANKNRQHHKHWKCEKLFYKYEL